MAPLPDGSVVSGRIPPKGKLIALSIVGLLIVSATIGILYLSGILGETPNERADRAAEGTDTTANTLNVYDADDATDDASPGTDDTLIRLQLTGQDTLSWTFVSIQLSVGDIVTSCGVVEGPDGDGCYIDQQGGSLATAWEPGEFIFLHEDGVDIVTGQGTTVGIHVTFYEQTVAGSGSQLVN